MAGSNNLSGNESILFADNMSFDGTQRGGAMSADGQLWIGSGTSDRPNNGGHVKLGNLTAGPGVDITNGPGTITIGLSGGGTGIDSISPDSGTNPVIPDSNGLVSIIGSGSTTSVGGTNSLTVQLTGLTNHNVLVGAGTSTITKVAPSATSGVPLISQGAASDPVFGTAVVAGGGTGSTSFNINGVVISNTTTTGALTALTLTNGQIVIGSTGASPVAGTITGTAIAVTTGAGTLSLGVTGGGLTWNNVTGATQTVFSRNGYIANRATLVTFTMNGTNIGDVARIVGKGAGGWTLLPTGSQIFYIGNQASTVTTGSLSSTNAGDCVELVALSSTEVIVMSSMGNITVV